LDERQALADVGKGVDHLAVTDVGQQQ
jgi:hypothetical protein